MIDTDKDKVWVCTACGDIVENRRDFSNLDCKHYSYLCHKDKVLTEGFSDSIATGLQDGAIVDPQPELDPDQIW